MGANLEILGIDQGIYSEILHVPLSKLLAFLSLYRRNLDILYS